MKEESVVGHESYTWNVFVIHKASHVILLGREDFCLIGEVQTHFWHGLACASLSSLCVLSPCSSHMKPV